jgi:glycosyltransferase involved in cell wall biosynthesis
MVEDPILAYSISAFFPCYNDGGTIASLIAITDRTLRQLADDYEIIIVNDGSSDYAPAVLSEMQTAYPCLRVITHERNRGYGGALRSGFGAATKDLIFYTDGDAQYDPQEIALLLPEMRDGVDMVNGYKISRSDPLHRIIIGRLYHNFVKRMFGLRLRDVDCDFRLLRRSVFDKVQLKSNSGVICLELVKKIQDAGCNIVEVPVHHFHRAYGQSQFFNIGRIWNVWCAMWGLWIELVWRKGKAGNPAKQTKNAPAASE